VTYQNADDVLSAPHTAKGKLQRAALALLEEHARDGALPTSGRFLFYETEQRGIVSKQRTGVRRPDQNFTEALTWLRDKDLVPWDWIVDETRRLTQWRYADTVADYIADVVDDARIDCWNGQRPPLILCESRPLAGVLEAHVAEYLCPIAATNGQARGFLVTKVAPLLQDGRRVLYLGDFDHQGGQIETATRRVLEGHAGSLEWERLALTDVQVRAYGLEALASQKPDNRYRPARRHLAVETEALSQAIIVTIVRDRLDALLPEPLEDVLELERQQRADFVEP
jgi:hypothetical protein